MKLSELRAILELSQLTHPGNDVLHWVGRAVENNKDYATFNWPVNVQTLRDLMPESALTLEEWDEVRLTWEPD